MTQVVMVAYSGGMAYDYLQDALRRLCAMRDQGFAFYHATRVSSEACSESITFWLGAAPLCKEPAPGDVDVLVALEELEGRRNARFLKPDGVCILCSAHRLPMSVAVGTVGYPNDILYRMVFEKRKVYQIRRVEITPCAVCAVLLRSLGCDQAACQSLLHGYDNAQQAIDYAFGLSFAK